MPIIWKVKQRTKSFTFIHSLISFWTVGRQDCFRGIRTTVGSRHALCWLHVILSLDPTLSTNSDSVTSNSCTWGWGELPEIARVRYGSVGGIHASYAEGAEFIPRPGDRVTWLKVFVITSVLSGKRPYASSFTFEGCGMRDRLVSCTSLTF